MVYLDLVMLLNFLVDLLLLVGTNRLAGYPPGFLRCALAAVLGGVYGGACLLRGFAFLGSFLWRMVSLGFMSVLAFGTGTGAMRRTMLFVLLSFALGGVALGLGNGGFWGLVSAGATVCALASLGFWGKQGQHFRQYTLAWGERRVTVTALEDTGNGLKDPVTGEPVLILGPAAAQNLTGLTREQLRCPVETLAAGAIPGLRLIPYRAVGQAQGMLLALKVRGERDRPVLVAFAPEGLGEGMGEFEALTGGLV